MISLIIVLINAYYIAFTGEGFVKNIDAMVAAVATETFVCVFVLVL